MSAWRKFLRVLPIVSTNANANDNSADVPGLLHTDANGNLWVRTVTSGGGSQTSGNAGADGIQPANLYALDVESFGYVLNRTTGFWDRRTSLADNADGQAAGLAGLAGTVARLQAWNPSGSYARLYHVHYASPAPYFSRALPHLAIGAGTYSYAGKQGSWSTQNWGPLTDAAFVRRLRASKFFALNLNAAGATVILSPPAGQKVWLLSYQLGLTGDASLAAAGYLDVTFQDISGPTSILAKRLWLPSAAGTTLGGYEGPLVELGHGAFTSFGFGLQINLSAALATGYLTVLAGLSVDDD